MKDGKYPKFRDFRQIGKDWKRMIVNIVGVIINENPTNEELKELEPYPGRSWTNIKKLLEKEMKEYLLEFLRYFYRTEGRTPIAKDFGDNPKYPHYNIYRKIFGSWDMAIELAGLWNKRRIRREKIYTDEELLGCLIQFYEENGRPPTKRDFTYNIKYPSCSTYKQRFGSWYKALKLVGLDVDSMVRKGVVETNQQKARLGEIFVIDQFKKIGVIDLSGKNQNSPYDGTCPHGCNYDVKTSKMRIKTFEMKDIYLWLFHFINVYKGEIEWYYLLAFNEDFSELIHAWRAPAWKIMGDIEKGYIEINFNDNYKYNIKNMRQYEITEKIKPIFEKWLQDIKVWSKEDIISDANLKLQRYLNDKRYYDGYIEEEDDVII